MIVILVARRTTPLSDQLTSIDPLTVHDPEREDLMVQDGAGEEESGDPVLNDLQDQSEKRLQA